jgi:hypothetical protein
VKTTIRPRLRPPYSDFGGTTGRQDMVHDSAVLRDVRAEMAALVAELDRHQCDPELRERLEAVHECIEASLLRPHEVRARLEGGR